MNDLPPLNHRILVGVHWSVKERQDGLWVPVHDFHNLLTDYGLTAYASAPSGQYSPPIYLVIEQSTVSVYSVANPGDTSIQLSGDPTIAGDTQIVLSVGLSNEETVTFTSIAGSSPTIATLSAPLANAHASGDPVVRGVVHTDTMSAVLSEAQYDPTFNPGNRMPMTSAYSPGVGQNTMQFFFSGATLTNQMFAHVGLTDQPKIGTITSNLHNYASLGYNHTNVNDLEIDVTYTLQTF
jgi:hypothetical protein